MVAEIAERERRGVRLPQIGCACDVVQGAGEHGLDIQSLDKSIRGLCMGDFFAIVWEEPAT